MNNQICVFCDKEKRLKNKNCYYEQLMRFFNTFCRFTDKRGPDECWPWMGARNPKGYGRIYYIKKSIVAHRAAWMIQNSGDLIPKGLFVLHKCDNPWCVNYKHLFLGTAADNTKDMMLKKRHKTSNNSYFGSKVFQATINESIALEIKQKIKQKLTCPEIAKSLNINKHIVYDIKRNKTWKHVILKE